MVPKNDRWAFCNPRVCDSYLLNQLLGKSAFAGGSNIFVDECLNPRKYSPLSVSSNGMVTNEICTIKLCKK